MKGLLLLALGLALCGAVFAKTAKELFDEYQAMVKEIATNKNPALHPKFRKIIEELGVPHEAFKTVKMGGNRGKSSVGWKIAKGLEAANFTVGMYSSPHLYSWRERIQINSVPIPMQEMIQLHTICKKYGLGISQEMACIWSQYFALHNVELAVIEDDDEVLAELLAPEQNVLPNLPTTEMKETNEYTYIKNRFKNLNRYTPLIFGFEIPLKMIHEQLRDMDYHGVVKVQYPDSHLFSMDEYNQAVANESLKYLSIDFETIKQEHWMLGIKYRLPSRMEKLTKEQLNKAGLKGKMPVNAYLDFASNGYALDRAFTEMERDSRDAEIRLAICPANAKELQAEMKTIVLQADFIHFIESRSTKIPIMNKVLAQGMKKEFTTLQGLTTDKETGLSMKEYVKKVLEAVKEHEVLLFAISSPAKMREIRGIFGFQDHSDIEAMAALELLPELPPDDVHKKVDL